MLTWLPFRSVPHLAFYPSILKTQFKPSQLPLGLDRTQFSLCRPPKNFGTLTSASSHLHLSRLFPGSKFRRSLWPCRICREEPTTQERGLLPFPLWKSTPRVKDCCIDFEIAVKARRNTASKKYLPVPHEAGDAVRRSIAPGLSQKARLCQMGVLTRFYLSIAILKKSSNQPR